MPPPGGALPDPAANATPPPWMILPGLPGGEPGGAPGDGASPAGPGAPGSESGSPSPGETPPPAAMAPGGSTGGSGDGGAGSRGDSGIGAGPAAAGDPAAALLPGRDRGRQLVLLAAAVSTGTTLAFAFVFLSRRRREAELDEDVLAAAAATPYAMPVAVPAFDPGTGGTDVDLPRWRRPSLMAARKSDPIRAFEEPARLTFERTAGDVDGERRLIRYRLVRLLDRPDELAGLTVHTLDAGDEVAVVEASGLYRRVITPDGRTGWLHKMTLGDVIQADAPDDDDELDPDVLLAYLAARARS
jgi:hypothetical protein